MIVFLALILSVALVGLGFQVAMVRRDQPHLGVWGLMLLIADGVAGVVYSGFAGV